MVCSLSVRGDSHCDANNAEEHEHECPPGKIWEAAMDGRYDTGDEGDNPGKL